MKHSNIVGGSTAKRVINCPGSVALVQCMPPQLESSYAAEGTFLHEAITRILLTGDMDGNTAEHIEEKLTPALRLLDELDPDGELELKLEQRVEIASGIFGSADVIGSMRGIGYVIDWKFGDGVPVPAEENEQLMFYACGAIKKFPHMFREEQVELAIIQPPHLRRWSTTKTRIAEFERALLRAVELAKSDDAPTVVGDHCRWCTAKPICPQMNGAVDRALRTKLDAINIAPAMANIPLLEAWIAEVKSLALRMLEDNVPVPGYKLVPKRGKRVWVDEQKARDYLLVQGLEESEITEMRSVAQIENMLKKRKLDMPHFVFVSSGNTIVPEGDPRSAVLNLGAALKKLR